VSSTGMNTCPQPWPSLINGLVNDALLELSPVRNKPLNIVICKSSYPLAAVLNKQVNLIVLFG